MSVRSRALPPTKLPILLAASAGAAAVLCLATALPTATSVAAAVELAPSAGVDSEPVDPAAEVENSPFQFTGQVNANAVYVRSGPSENDYATMKLDKGDTVTAVGVKFGWLKILPPEGSFCYVAKAYVEKRNDGKVGRVTNALFVRVGSELLPMKTKVAAKLEPGQDVQIVGEQDEYFKIKPPADVYLYISQQFVDPVKRVDVPGIAAAAPADAPAVAARDTAPETPAAPAGGTTPPTQPEATPDQPTAPIAGGAPAAEQPADRTITGAEAPAVADASATPVETASPATQPAIAAELEFDRLETRIREVSGEPIQAQPVPELLAGYEKLVQDASLPESMRRVAEYRVSTLKVHNENREMILAHERDQQSRQQALLALQREGDELMERVKSTGIVYYTAVGTLRPSSLQFGEGTLYRLTDPVTERTLVYVKASDPKVISMNGLFVGVKGEIVDDQNWKLKWIAPTELDPIDQRRVNRNIAAQIIPPSLMPGGALMGSGKE